jgi:hypothetical protein
MKTFKAHLEEACWKGYKAIGVKDKGGRKVPNCVPVSKEEVELDETKDHTEYEDPHMAVNQLRSIIHNAQEMLDLIGDDSDLPEWIESKITLAEDYLMTSSNYMRSEMKESYEHLDEKSPAWQRKAGKNPEGGLNKKGVASYRREHPGSKLKTAVTTKPSKLDPDSKSAKRRKSFCARMSGMKKKLTSSKTASDPDSRINKSLRKWNC